MKENTSGNNWFYEEYGDGARFGIRIERLLAKEKSPYQDIRFYASPEFGTFFTLDDFIMLTERDEFIYHEMIAHVPMATRPDAQRALIIGGGDGGSARELLRYPALSHIDIVEIDEAVVRLCQKFLPQTAHSFDNPRVSLHIGDGAAWVEQSQDKYDIILIDSTDPIGVGEGLFSLSFYENCRRRLNTGGVLINQHESPFYEGDAAYMKNAHQKLRQVFPIAKVYQFHMPTYASGHWLFGFASVGTHPIKDLQAEIWNKLAIRTKYYNTKLHKACFCLPNYVLAQLNA